MDKKSFGYLLGPVVHLKKIQKSASKLSRTSDNIGPALNLWLCALTLALGSQLPQGANSRAAGGRAVRPRAGVPGSDLKHRTTPPHLPRPSGSTRASTEHCIQSQVKWTTNRPRQRTSIPMPAQPCWVREGSADPRRAGQRSQVPSNAR